MIDPVVQQILYNDLAQISRNPPSGQRRGQALYNHLRHHPALHDFANKITGTEADCFYDDKKIPAFYTALYAFCNPAE